MIKFLKTLRWLYSDRPLCSLCGEKVRDLALHRYVDHADGT
jgi:hypothetical protein